MEVQKNREQRVALFFLSPLVKNQFGLWNAGSLPRTRQPLPSTPCHRRVPDAQGGRKGPLEQSGVIPSNRSASHLKGRPSPDDASTRHHTPRGLIRSPGVGSNRRNGRSDRRAPGFKPRAQFAFKDSMIHGILQFTLRIAVCCVLHRRTSRGVHR